MLQAGALGLAKASANASWETFWLVIGFPLKRNLDLLVDPIPSLAFICILLPAK
jgi:hypothetical protein